VLHRRLLTVAAGLAAAALAPAGAAQAAPSPSYVAIGDSYAAGVGAPPYQDQCLRSPHGYPALLAIADTTSNACSGAVTADVTASQLGGLSRRTTLVTVTIGGNDLGFSSGIGVCMQGTDADCAGVVTDAKAFATTTLPGRLDTTYEAIRARAPRARIVVTGYAHFFEATADCAAVPPASLAKRTALNEAVDTLNDVIEERATGNGAVFADVQDSFAGHGLCSTEPWITGPADSAPFHPTATGYSLGYLPGVREAADCR
jgi:lysophospholipase L1-like esterase